MSNIWLLLAIAAYLLSAVAFVVDKHLLAIPIPKPFAYAFWVSILSTPVFFLIPFFNIYVSGVSYFIIAFMSGLFFFAALVLLYRAIRKTDISVASTQVGVITAIFTYLLSLIILKEIVPLHSAIALTLLIIGMLFLGKVGRGVLKYTLFAGIFFALSFVLLKLTFNMSDFVNGIFWTRVGFIGTAILSLISKRARIDVASSFHNAPPTSKTLFIANKILAGTAFVLLYYAILLGRVFVINALLGFQFLFIFLLTIILHRKLPGVKENLSKKTLFIKLTGIILVVFGFLAIMIQ